MRGPSGANAVAGEAVTPGRTDTDHVGRGGGETAPESSVGGGGSYIGGGLAGRGRSGKSR